MPEKTLDGEGGPPVLRSAIVANEWERVDAAAHCTPLDTAEWGRKGRHRIPDPKCSCGIHAFKQPIREVWIGAGVWADARIRMWGRVLEGHRGFRAERARIMAPLSVWIRCEPDPGLPGWNGIHCLRAPVVVVIGRRGYVPLCEWHRDRAGELGDVELRPNRFGGLLSTGLHRRYGIEIAWRGDRPPWT
jgi:hypothetical protein